MPLPPIPDDELEAEQRRLASVDDLKAYLRAGGGTIPDASFELWLDSASDRLNGHRQFYASGPSTRTFRVGGSYARLSDLRLTEEHTVVADGVELGPGDLRFLWLTRPVVQPAHAVVLNRPVGQLEVTGHWGFAEPPSGIVDACLFWASRAFNVNQGRGSDVFVDGTTGETRQYFARTPSYVLAALQDYRVPSL